MIQYGVRRALDDGRSRLNKPQCAEIAHWLDDSLPVTTET